MCANTAPYGYSAMLVMDVVHRIQSWVDCWFPLSFGNQEEGIQVSSSSGVSVPRCLVS